VKTILLFWKIYTKHRTDWVTLPTRICQNIKIWYWHKTDSNLWPVV